MFDHSAARSTSRTRVIRYDDFQSPAGYGPDDYLKRWNNIYGPGELARGGSRAFEAGAFTVSAIPFRTGADDGVLDHIKYFAASAETFKVPRSGSVMLEATITARTPGTGEGRVVHGSYGPAGSYPKGPGFEATLLEPQQAAATIHLIDFHTCLLYTS
ncbi:MAG: hypothetical protein IAE87_09655, partial [Rhodobacteraceae bacterium]|nr:hypothetical protein [Paracoccaceae bacterium]